MGIKEGEGKGSGKGKAIIWITLAAIMLASIFGTLAPISARDGTGAIERGDVVFCGEKGLDISAIIASGGWFYGIAGTPTEGDFFYVVNPTDFDVPTTVTVGPYNVTSSEGTVADIVIDEPEITADVFIESTNYSIVGKTIPQGTNLTVHIEPNFGGLLKSAADGSWGKLKIRFYRPDGVCMTVGMVDADAQEINVTSSDCPELDTSGWKLGEWKVKIKTDKATCNDVDVSSPYYEFTIRSEELSIEAEEEAVDQGEDINLTVTGNPITYYYLIVTHVNTDNPPEIKYTSDVLVLDEWGDAYPATGTPNLAAWIKTGCDCTANVTIDTTGAAEMPYRINVYDTMYPVFPDFVPDDGVEEEDDDDVDVWVGTHETPSKDEWNRTFGGSDWDEAYSVQQTADGGYILGGYTRSYGAGRRDFWLVKTDSNGTEQWNQTYGGPDDEEAWGVQQTSDGGYILAGYTESYGEDWSEDFWLVKTDSGGNEQWNQTFGGPYWDEAYSVQQTADGGYILAGVTYSYGAGDEDVWLVKTDSIGNEQWNKTFYKLDSEGAYSVQQTSDDGYVIAGYTDSYGYGCYADIWLIKTDPGGNEQWNQTFGWFDSEEAYSVQQTTDGGYILAGSTGSYGAGDDDFWLVKTDSNGTEQWKQTFGGPYWDEAYSVQQTVDGGYILAGGTSPYDVGGSDLWVVKTDSNGNEQWNKTFGSTGHDEAYSVQQTADGGFILAGYTSSYGAGNGDAWLVKVKREEPGPHAKFIYTPKNPVTNQLITFDASSSYDPYGNITNYKWNFGDGNITNTTDKVITHSYVLEGDYTVNLTVTNDEGRKDSVSEVISVKSPEGDWSKTFGGSGYEEARSVQQTVDGGYIFTGHTSSYGAGYTDFWLVKADFRGSEEWNKTFGGTNQDMVWAGQQTIDDGYILAGETYSRGAGLNDFLLVKTDFGGNEEWNKTFGGTSWDKAWAVQQTTDGGYILVGLTGMPCPVPRTGEQIAAGDYILARDMKSYGTVFGDAWVVKTDSEGNELWNKTFGGAANDWMRSVQQTVDGGYIIAGLYGANSGDFWLVKIDSNGTELWSKTFGGPERDEARSVQQTTDGGYILTGCTFSYGAGDGDFWLIKTDPYGNEQWNKTFGGLNRDGGNCVEQTSSGDYIITGETGSYGAGSEDVWLIKTDFTGNEQWNKTFGGPELDEAFSVQQTADGGYVLAGVTMSYGAGFGDAWLVKVKGEPTIFDTEPSENPYPSIMGTHNGTITPSCTINVSKLYTYSCVGTGGHTESIDLYENDTLIANGTWNGYIGDYNNITLHNVSGAPYVMLLEEHKYNYTIITGSYPQIIHERSKDVTGGVINCTEFIDANGKEYNDWIPAIRLE